MRSLGERNRVVLGGKRLGSAGERDLLIFLPSREGEQPEERTAITAGGSHSCALLADETVWCWRANSTGQLGLAATSDNCRLFGIFSEIVPCSVNPLPVPYLTNVTAIAAGKDYTCARLTDTTVRCWGGNSSGQLGRNTSLSTTPASHPAPVTGLSKVATLATGVQHSCARLTDGTAQCWGAKDGGQLGNTTPTPCYTPVPVSGLSNMTAVAAGSAHSCALLTDGAVWCWGTNGSLQLGDSSITKSTAPIKVRSLSNVTSLASFGNFTCAVLTGSTVTCWGDNTSGQLGRNTSLGTTPASLPAPVTDLSYVVAVVTGGRYACARLTDGTVKCWGNNDQGQLGPHVPRDPSTGKPFRESLIPVAVGLSNVAALAAGFDYTCAVLTNSTVTWWGANSPTPSEVGLADVDTIAIGGEDCAIFKNRTVSCSLLGILDQANLLLQPFIDAPSGLPLTRFFSPFSLALLDS